MKTIWIRTIHYFFWGGGVGNAIGFYSTINCFLVVSCGYENIFHINMTHSWILIFHITCYSPLCNFSAMLTTILPTWNTNESIFSFIYCSIVYFVIASPCICLLTGCPSVPTHDILSTNVSRAESQVWLGYKKEGNKLLDEISRYMYVRLYAKKNSSTILKEKRY